MKIGFLCPDPYFYSPVVSTFKTVEILKREHRSWLEMQFGGVLYVRSSKYDHDLGKRRMALWQGRWGAEFEHWLYPHGVTLWFPAQDQVWTLPWPSSVQGKKLHTHPWQNLATKNSPSFAPWIPLMLWKPISSWVFLLEKKNNNSCIFSHTQSFSPGQFSILSSQKVKWVSSIYRIFHWNVRNSCSQNRNMWILMIQNSCS